MCSIRQIQPMKFLLVLLAISAVYCLEGEKSARGAVECLSHADCNTRELCQHGHCVERFDGRSRGQPIECGDGSLDDFDDCPGGSCVGGKCHFDESSHEKVDESGKVEPCKTTDDCPDMTICYKTKCIPWHFDEKSHEKRDESGKVEPCKTTDDCPDMTICYKTKCIPWHFDENSHKKLDDDPEVKKETF
ncbi:unnamed protein product [Caenorhabditis brenneri]